MEPKRILYEGHLITEHRKAIIDFILSLTEKVKGKKVLDVGAGTWLKPRQIFKPICSYTACDVFTDPLIDIVCPIENLVEGIGHKKYDVILAFEMLEHVKNPFDAAKQLYQVLKPGGLLAITTPFNFWIHAFGEQNGFHDYWRFTDQGLKVLFQDFKQLEITAIGDVRFPTGYHLLGYKECI